jgi:hypothetical protein
MKLRPIPNPVMGPYPRNKAEPALKPLEKPDLKALRKPKTTKKASPVQAAPAPQQEPKPAALTPIDKAVPVTVVGPDGAPIPQIFKPVDAMEAMSSPNAVMAMVMLRQLRDMQGPMPDTSTGALALIHKLEAAVKSGGDVASLKEEIERFLVGDDSHNEIFLRLSSQHDRERADQMKMSLAKWEDFCHACMRRSDLNVVEGMVFATYMHSELTKIYAAIEKRIARGDSPMSREPATLIEGLNRPTVVQKKEIQQKFTEASPQEREILRKLGFRLEAAIAAKITKIKETQTVEIVQTS